MEIKKLFYIMLAISLLCACRSNSKKTLASPEKERYFQNVFKYDALQDSLSAFISEVDSFPNPYGKKETIYDIFVYREHQDTIVFFLAYSVITCLHPEKMNSAIVYGAVKEKNKVLALISHDVGYVDYIINVESFDLDTFYIYSYHDEAYKYDWDVPPVKRKYRLSKTGNNEYALRLVWHN